MKEIKLSISKSFPTRTYWTRQRTIGKLIILPGVSISTEAELCRYIFNTYGEGRYHIVAWQKGLRGFWLYWLGNINEQGFIRDKRKNKELDKLKGELVKKDLSYEERENIEEEMNFSKEINKIERSMKKSACFGLIKFSAGVLHSFDEAPVERRRV